jgi:hypothetical protein
MPITVAHDAIHVNVPHLPPGQACGYTTGTADIRWTAADWAKHPDAVRIDQDYRASDWTADVLDVERGAATNAGAAHWYTMAQRSHTAGTRPGQRHPAIYTSASNITSLVNALIAGGVKSGPGLWVAKWDFSSTDDILAINNASGPFPIIGGQFADGTPGRPYDTSVFSGSWLASGSVMPIAAGPYLHHTHAGDTWASIAAARNTTVEHLAGLSAAEPLPAGVPYRTANP